MGKMWWKLQTFLGTLLENFQHLSENYNLDIHDLFRYLQVKQHFDRNTKIIGESDKSTVIIWGTIHKKQVSTIYTWIQFLMKYSTLYFKIKWEKKANVTPIVDDRLNMWIKCQLVERIFMKEFYVLLLQKENSYKIADMTNSNTTISGFEIDNSCVIVYLSNILPDYYIQNKYFTKALLIDSKKEIIGKWLDKEPPTKD